MAMNSDDIQKALDAGVGDGAMSRDIDGRYRLTERGEAQAMTAMGGTDVVNVTMAALALSERHGTLLHDLNDKEAIDALREWLKEPALMYVIQRFVFVVRHYWQKGASWDEFVDVLEDDVLAPARYFEQGMVKAKLPKAFREPDKEATS